MNEWIKNNKIEIVSKIKYVFTEEKKKKKKKKTLFFHSRNIKNRILFFLIVEIENRKRILKKFFFIYIHKHKIINTHDSNVKFIFFNIFL